MPDLLPQEQRSKRAKIANLLGTLGLAAVLVSALALFVTSLFCGAMVSPIREKYRALQIDWFEENEWMNLLLTVVAAGLLRLIFGRLRITSRALFGICAAVLTCELAFGLAWTLSVKAYAESDGLILSEIADMIVRGDITELQTLGAYRHYFLVRYPYLCGFLSYLELLRRLFGAVGLLVAARVINTILFVSSNLAVLLTTHRLYRDSRVTLLTCLLLGACVQPLLGSTFVYGLIPSLAFVAWAVYFLSRYLQEERTRWLIPAVLLFAAGVYFRSNVWIAIVAACIVLMLSALRRKKWRLLLAAVLIVCTAYPAPKLIQKSYEQRLNTSFGSGYPKSYWMAMSLQKGWEATGWYAHRYSAEIGRKYGEDVEGIDRQARADIRSSMKALWSDPQSLGAYYLEKAREPMG